MARRWISGADEHIAFWSEWIKSIAASPQEQEITLSLNEAATRPSPSSHEILSGPQNVSQWATFCFTTLWGGEREIASFICACPSPI
jgi:hypothetical protein